MARYSTTAESRSPPNTHGDLHRRSPPHAMSNNFVGSYAVNSTPIHVANTSLPAPRLTPPGKESSSSVRPVHSRRTAAPSVAVDRVGGRSQQNADLSFSTQGNLSMSDLSSAAHHQQYVVNAPVVRAGSGARGLTVEAQPAMGLSHSRGLPGVQQAMSASTSAMRSVRNL